MELRRDRRHAFIVIAVALVTLTPLVASASSADAAGASATFSLVGPTTVAAGSKFAESAHTLVTGDTTNVAEADLAYPSPAMAFLGADNVGSPLTSAFFNGGGNGQTFFVSGVFGGNDPTGDILISNNVFRAPCAAGQVKISFLPSSAVVGDTTGADINTGYPSKTIKVTALAAGKLCVSPSTTGQGASSRSITVTGSQFAAGTTVSFGAGVTIKKVVVQSSSKIVATVAVAKTAALGDRNVSTKLPSGKSLSCSACFTVTAAPVPTSVDQPVISRGTTVATSVFGSNFVIGAKVTVSGSGVTATATGGTPGRVDLSFTATAGAAKGKRNVTVTNPDGGVGVCTGCLTVS